MSATKHIWIIGMYDLIRQKLDALRRANECEFHPVLTYGETHGADAYHPDDMMNKAVDILDSAEEPIDAIVSFWDFPVMCMTPLLAERYGTTWHSLETILKCEHKYWSRCNQQEVIPEFVPEFCRFDPHDEKPREQIDLEYPFWIKPMISFGGHLGYKVESDEEFRKGIQGMRDGIDRFAKPFEYFAGRLPDDTDFPGMDGGFALAEKPMEGNQCTVEGYSIDGDVRRHGIVDSHRFPNLSTFSRYQYPSNLPEDVHDRMSDASRTFMEHVGFDVGGWNIEYFHEPETGEIRLLEVNGRISVSHSDLFDKVDGQSNHEVVIASALGEEPDWRKGAGKYPVAGKFFVRKFTDGKIVRTPTATQVQKVREIVPRTIVDVLVEPDTWLHDLQYQESYSYKLAAIYLGGRDEHDMLQRFQEVIGELDFAVLTPEEIDSGQYEGSELKQGAQQQT